MAERQRVALVTGAGRTTGIGYAIAARLLRDGYAVGVSDLGEDGVAPAGLLGAGTALAELGEVHIVTCDVRDEAQVDDMVSSVVDRFGRLDVMVNNAGVGSGLAEVVDLPLDTWRLNLDVMATGVFLGSRAAARRMIFQGDGGRIVTIASQAGKSGMALLGAYSAAKFAAIGFTQALAHELGPHRITVNAVCPGTIDTEMLEAEGGLLQSYADRFGMEKDRYRSRIARTIPAGRFGVPDDIAGCVSWLVSEDAAFVTGEAVNVTGGQVMH